MLIIEITGIRENVAVADVVDRMGKESARIEGGACETLRIDRW